MRLFIIRAIILCSLVYFNTLSAQESLSTETKLIEYYLVNEDLAKADSVLIKNIKKLKQNESYLELSKHIYYVGKIALSQGSKDLAIQKVNEFANSITDVTDSLLVSRQKHLALSRFYALLRDYKKASSQNLLALEETKKIPDATGDLYGLIHHNLSIDFIRLGHLEKAIWHSRKSLRYYLSYPDSDKTRILDAYNSMGARMWDAYKIDSALFYFIKGEKIINELEQIPMNKFYHLAKTQSNISSVYSLLGQSKDAQKYNEKAIKNYTNFINSDTDSFDFFREEARLFLFMTIENYADDFSAEGNYKKAKNLIKYVKKEKLKIYPSNDSEIGYTNIQLGNIYLKLKEYKEAELLFNEALKIYDNQEQKNYLRLADVYYYKGILNDYYENYNNAKLYYEKSKEFYNNVFGNEYDAAYLDAMLTYSKFYSKNGHTDKALEMSIEAYDYVIKNQGQGVKTNLEYTQLLNLSNIYYDSKNYDEASKHLNKALQLLNSSSNISFDNLTVSFKKPMALLLKSKIALKLAKEKDSVFLKTHYLDLKEAISILEKQKTIITEDKNVSIIIEDNNEIFEFSKYIALQLYEDTKNPKYLKELLSFHESKLYNKIRQQLNVKANFSSKHVPDNILEQEKQLKAELSSSLNNEGGLDKFIKANENWLNFIETLKVNYPKYYDLRYASISKSLNVFNTNFKENTTVIRYVFINDKLYAFVIEKNKLEVHPLNTLLTKILL